MERFIDLHIHSNYSDGTLSPREIVIQAIKRNLSAIAIADHDMTFAIPEAMEEGEKHKLEVVPAVELSVRTADISRGANQNGSHQETHSNADEENHILGYYIDWKNAQLQEKLLFLRQKRKERALKIYEKLANLGVKLNQEILEKIEKNNVSIGRLHFARAMIKEEYVPDITQVFQRYLSYGQPAYVEKVCFPPKEVIEMITLAGGIPILAHPCFGPQEETIHSLISYGIRGIEVWHRRHSPEFTKRLLSLAKKEGLLITGGSDCHGEVNEKESLIGKIKVPYAVLEELKQCLPQNR